MKKLLFLIAAVLAALPVLAEEVGPATFVGSTTLWVAILVGFVASFLTLYNANKVGGDIANILWFFGIGMLGVVIGFLAVVVGWATPAIQKIVHDLVFIAGYVVMGIGAVRLAKLGK